MHNYLIEALIAYRDVPTVRTPSHVSTIFGAQQTTIIYLLLYIDIFELIVTDNTLFVLTTTAPYFEEYIESFAFSVNYRLFANL